MTAPPGDFLSVLQHWGSTSPQAPAVVDDDGVLTHAGLVAAVEAEAADLTAVGVGPGDRVALVAENSRQHLVSAFAVWRAGAVLVTMYPSSGQGDLAYCLASSDPVLVVTDQACEAAVREAAPADLPVAIAGRLPQLPPGVRTAAPSATSTDGTTPALICFTSGSTSHPKAVVHSASGVLGGAAAYAGTWHYGPDDRTVVSLPMAWAYGLVTTSMATLVGGGAVLPLRRSRPEMLLRAVVVHGATVLPGVTTMFARLIEHVEATGGADLSSLRFCVSGGEPRNERVLDAWTALSGVPVHDTFCATEAFPAITYDPLLDPVPVRGSAGKVVPGAQMRVVGPDGVDVAPGLPGEALWRSPATMLGYWGEEEQTSAALTPDGWYRTRDLVRVDPEGYVFVVGRLSDMIIRGGSNVSPAEVETVLRGHRDVVSVAVVGLPDEDYGQRVVAAVVPGQPGSFDAAAVQAYAASQLASYKVPTEVVVVSALPVSATTGKIDRRRVAADLSELAELEMVDEQGVTR